MHYTQFQALSACEAMSIDKSIAKVIVEVFQAGIKTAFLMNTTSPHPNEWPENAKYYLGNIGVHVSDEIALQMIVSALASAVSEEHRNEDIHG